MPAHPGCNPAAAPCRAHRLRGGVSGRLVPPKLNFCLSAGLRIRKEHIKLSSTDITCAPHEGWLTFERDGSCPLACPVGREGQEECGADRRWAGDKRRGICDGGG
eukprot:3050021-Prymnesium_polylepis.1